MHESPSHLAKTPFPYLSYSPLRRASPQARNSLVPREGKWIRPECAASISYEDRARLLPALGLFTPTDEGGAFGNSENSSSPPPLLDAPYLASLARHPSRRDELRTVLLTIRSLLHLAQAQQPGVRGQLHFEQSLRDATAARIFGAAATATAAAASSKMEKKFRTMWVLRWRVAAELAYGRALAAHARWGEAAEAAIHSELLRMGLTDHDAACPLSPRDASDGWAADDPYLLQDVQANALLTRCLAQLPDYYRTVLETVYSFDAFERSTSDAQARVQVQGAEAMVTGARMPHARALAALRSLNARAAEDALPEFKRPRPKYYYYFQHAEERIRALCPGLPDAVVHKMLGLEAGELEMTLGSTEATAARARELVAVLEAEGAEGLARYHVPMLPYEAVERFRLTTTAGGGGGGASGTPPMHSNATQLQDGGSDRDGEGGVIDLDALD